MSLQRPQPKMPEKDQQTLDHLAEILAGSGPNKYAFVLNQRDMMVVDTPCNYATRKGICTKENAPFFGNHCPGYDSKNTLNMRTGCALYTV